MTENGLNKTLYINECSLEVRSLEKVEGAGNPQGFPRGI
jgi:hypothetical protein